MSEPAAPSSSPPPPALIEIAAARRTVLTDLLGVTEQPFSVDFVHDLRVATRRLTEVLGILETLMAKPAARAVADSLRDLRRGAGSLRDLDVLGEHLEKARFPRAVAALRGDILADLPGQRAALGAQLVELMRAPSLSGALVLLARTLEQATANSATAEAALVATLDKRIVRRRKQLRKRFGQACLKQTPGALHQARIAVKKLRYALELAHEAGRKGIGRELRLLKGVQRLLGDMHDTDVILSIFQTHVQGPSGGTKGLRPAWGKRQRRMNRRQTHRAVRFFGRAFQWLNVPRA